MTTATVREMPRIVFPGQGESFASWMLRLAARLDLDPSTLQTRTGLVDERRGTVDAPVGYGITLTDQQRANLSFATRTPAERVDATLLSWLDGGPIDLTGLNAEDDASLRKVALFQWAYFSSTHACGDCLQETGWQWSLTWRLPWLFACTRHGRFLASACPRCDQPFMIARRDRIYGPPLGSLVPHPERCNNPLPRGVAVRSRTPVPCGHALHDLPTPVVACQALLDAQTVLEAHATGRDRPVSWWMDLRAVSSVLMRFLGPAQVDPLLPGLPDAVRAAVDTQWAAISDREMARAALDDHRSGPRTRSHTNTPDDPLLFAPYATLALAAVDSVHDADAAGDVLPVLYGQAQRYGNLLHLLLERGASPALIRVAGTLSARNAILTRAPSPRPNRSARVAAQPSGETPNATLAAVNIPWLWWPDQYAEVKALFPPDITDNFGRAYLSLAAAKVLTHSTWIGCAEQIGWIAPDDGKHTANSNISRLRRHGTLDDVNAHVHAVLDDLERSPTRVDYAARRHRLAGLSQITSDQWEDLVRLAGVDLPPKTWRLRGVAAWLWHHHGLNPTREFPGFSAHGNRNTAVEMYRRFRHDDLPQIESALRASADSLVT